MIGYQQDDGGRADAGYSVKSDAGDCVARALAIVAQVDYQDAYKALANANAAAGHRRSARNGVLNKIRDKVYAERGLRKVKLGRGPRPTWSEAHERYGDCIVSTTKHVAAIVDGKLHDTVDCRTYNWDDGSGYIETRERKAASVWVREEA